MLRSRSSGLEFAKITIRAAQSILSNSTLPDETYRTSPASLSLN